MVVVTSIRVARRRLRYESWHLLHLYAYLGVGLALPHQLWTGAAVHRLARRAPSSGGRPGRPPRRRSWSGGSACRRTAPSATTCGSPRWCARPTASCRSTSPAATCDSLRVEAGQFFSWRFLAGPGWSRAHPYSLSAAPDGRSLRITVKDLGDGSRDVARLRPGTRVLVEGPYGRLSARARTRRHVALIGAGVGITPLRSLAEGLAYAPGEAVLVHRYADQPLFGHELAVLAAERGLRVVDLPGLRRHPRQPARRALLHHVPDLAHRDVYVCGPEEWAEADRPRGPRCRPPARAPPHRDLRVVTLPMKRIVLWLLSTVSAVVLLFGYHTSTSGPAATAQAPVGASLATTSTTTTSGGTGLRLRHRLRARAPGSASSAGRRDTSSPSGTTVTGEVAQTRWGPVQVQLTTDGSGTITRVEVVQYPSGNGDGRADQLLRAARG